MDNLSILVDDWIRSLRTMDSIRSQVNIESIQENFHLFNITDKRSLILAFLKNIQNENSEIFIKNYATCLATINQYSVVSSLELLQNTINPLVSKYILESTINRSPQPRERIDALLAHCMSDSFSALFAYTISLITDNSLSEYVPTLKSFYHKHISLLVDHFNGSHDLQASEYVILLENIHVLLISLNEFKVKTTKESYQQLLSYLCEEKVYSLFDPSKKKLSKVISQLFLNIAVLGDNTSYLQRQFHQVLSEKVKISIIHKLSEPNEEMYFKYTHKFLREIAKDDDYFAFAVASMVKIGGEEVKKYILSVLQSGQYRRVFFSTYFLPYLNFPTGIYDEVIQDLLTYKQPLILKQALWVIRKKKLSKFMSQAVKLLFHESDQVSKEAQKLFLESPNSIEHLSKTINYYGPEKQEVLSHLIAKLRKLNL